MPEIRVAASHHWLYDTFADEWTKLAHVREGTGGFIDGTYLVAHPREWQDHDAATPRKPTKKLKARRTLANYDNLAATILETKKSSLFRESPTRRSRETEGLAETPLDQWWASVDGAGQHIDDAMPRWWDLAATFGHVVLYFDLPSEPATTAADQALPKVIPYTPLDVIDWLEDDDGQVTSIRVVEAIPATAYLSTRQLSQPYRIREIDATGWKLWSAQGQAVEEGEHGLGRVPFVYLYGHRRTLYPQIGRSVLGDPRQYIDLYNLESELRELLRGQTFSFINLPLGTGPDAMSVEQAQTLLGNQSGTMNVLFSAQAASILTGDASNVASYMEALAAKRREIYRGAGVPWEQDTKGVEAEGALGLKREDFELRQAAYADECERVEYELADLVGRWTYGEQGPERLERDGLLIQYPDRFSRATFTEVQQQASAASALKFPEEVLKVLRKALLTKFEGMANLTFDEKQALIEAIETAEPPPNPADLLRQKLEGQAGRSPMKSMKPGTEEDEDAA